MVQRYAHLSLDHLVAAVEKISMGSTSGLLANRCDG